VVTTTITSAEAGSDRYREAERSLWSHYGLEASERFVELSSPAVTLRVVELGSGPPVLFIPGTAGTGPYWGSLVRSLTGVRCLMLDRPGWGLSTPLDYTSVEYGTAVADLLRGLLDTLEIEKADVVGASIGDLWALRLASRHPSRVGRIALLGGGPIVAESAAPGIIRLIASPIGAIMVRLPQTPERVQAFMRQAGHGASLDAGRIPEEYMRWRVAFERETDSMRNERAMVRSIVSWRKGLRPGLTLGDAELAAIRQPTLLVYGTADPVGTVDLWRRVVDLLPGGELQLIDGAGHMPWLDDPSRVAGHLRRFLAT
jgi:2-hydroxy-6-oxonona-2,4-dienedioate hydrolase